MNKKCEIRKELRVEINGRGGKMLGFLLNHKETREMEYILKKEMEELLLDLTDPRIDDVVKKAMEEKYQIVFGIYRRVASPKECLNYMRTPADKRLNN